MASTSKKARIAAPLDEALDALELATSAITRRHAHSFSTAQVTRFVGAMEKLMVTQSEVLALRQQMARDQRAWPVDEVLLPSDMLVATLCHVEPTDLAASSTVCRHFLLAAKLAVEERGGRLGVLPGVVAKLNAQKLGVLEKHATVANQHIVALSSRASREALMLLSTDILRLHFVALTDRLGTLVARGFHLPSAPPSRTHELQETLSLLDKFQLPPRFVAKFAPERIVLSAVDVDAQNLAQPCVLKTLLTLLAAQWPICKRAIDLISSGADWSARMRYAIVATDTEMAAFKTVLVSGTESLFMMDILRLLEKLPPRALAPLRGHLVEQSRGRDEEYIVQKASEILIAMEMEGV